jgi:hypothetical protein
MRILEHVALLCLCLSVASTACGGGSSETPAPTPTLTPSPTATSAYTTYVNESHGFSIRYPSCWDVDEEACIKCGGPLVAFKAPQVCGNMTTQFEIKKDELDETMDIEEYFDYKRQGILLLDDYTPISDKELTVDGRDAIQHEFTYTFGQTVYIIALILLDDDTGWYVYCTCAEDCASECEEVFDDMAGSFQILNQAVQ